MDQADLYDYEIAQIAKVWQRLNNEWAHKPNTKANLEEFAKVAHQAFLDAGFVVNVQWENTLIMVPDITAPGGMSQMPVTVEVLGRAGANKFNEKVEGHELFDHDYKSFEVKRSKERNEDFLGQKERGGGRG